MNWTKVVHHVIGLETEKGPIEQSSLAEEIRALSWNKHSKHSPYSATTRLALDTIMEGTGLSHDNILEVAESYELAPYDLLGVTVWFRNRYMRTYWVHNVFSMTCIATEVIPRDESEGVLQ